MSQQRRGQMRSLAWRPVLFRTIDAYRTLSAAEPCNELDTQVRGACQVLLPHDAPWVAALSCGQFLWLAL